MSIQDHYRLWYECGIPTTYRGRILKNYPTRARAVHRAKREQYRALTRIVPYISDQQNENTKTVEVVFYTVPVFVYRDFSLFRWKYRLLDNTKQG